MHEPHIHEAFADDAELFEVDQAWLEELDDDDDEPITIRTRRHQRSRFVLGALVAGAALAGAIARRSFFGRRALQRQRLGRWSIAAALGALAGASIAMLKVGFAAKSRVLLLTA